MPSDLFSCLAEHVFGGEADVDRIRIAGDEFLYEPILVLQVDGDGVGFDAFFAEDVFEGFTVFGRERRGEREEKRGEEKKRGEEENRTF